MQDEEGSARTGVALLVGLGVALVVAGLVYTAYATAYPPDPVDASTGPEHEMHLAQGEQEHRELSWATTLELAAPAEAYELDIVLPYTVETVPRSADGARVWTNVTVNGQVSNEHLLRAGPGNVSLAYPGPRLDTSLFEEGPNRIEANATIQRSPSHEGSANLTIGPLLAKAHPRDVDGDGVVDTEQPVQGLHTGLAGLLLGVGVGAGTGYATDRFDRARQEAQP